ncbi:MAG: type II secretion system protein [Oscillospiraceae bacterium]
MKTRIGDKGFTFVELLVAIMILGVVAGPLLHSMVTSMRTAAKSRELQSQTLTAQNIAEAFNSSEISDILSDIKIRGEVKGISNDAGVYIIDEDSAYSELAPESVNYGEEKYHIGLKNVSFGGKSYDAMVTLDAGAYSFNEEHVSIYTNMDAVFTQPNDKYREDGTIIPLNSDSVAAEYFSSQAESTGEIVDFKNAMNRTIEINVVESGTSATVTAKYIYDASYIDRVEAVYDDEGNLVSDYYEVPVSLHYETDKHYIYTGQTSKLSNLYFFYYPNYRPGYFDNINIYNNYYTPDGDINRYGSALKFTLFLVKQAMPAPMPGYKAKLTLTEPLNINNEPTLYLCTNLDDSSVQYWYNAIFRSQEEINKELVLTDDLNRLYAVTVELYSPGSGFSGDKLYTFEATKVD